MPNILGKSFPLKILNKYNFASITNFHTFFPVSSMMKLGGAKNVVLHITIIFEIKSGVTKYNIIIKISITL